MSTPYYDVHDGFIRSSCAAKPDLMLDWKASWPEHLDKSRVSLAPDILSQTYSETMLIRKSVSFRTVGNPEVIELFKGSSAVNFPFAPDSGGGQHTRRSTFQPVIWAIT
jgi:hypothetical protein